MFYVTVGVGGEVGWCVCLCLCLQCSYLLLTQNSKDQMFTLQCHLFVYELILSKKENVTGTLFVLSEFCGTVFPWLCLFICLCPCVCVCVCVYSTCMCVCVHAWSCISVISFSAGTLCVPIKDYIWHLCLHNHLCILHAVCTAVGGFSLSWSLKSPHWQLKASQVFSTSSCRHLLYQLSEYESVWTLGLLTIYSTKQLV